MTDRRRVFVLVPHEPTLDPRVHYTAQSLAREHDVTVIATVQESEARPKDNDPPNMAYETVRIPYEKQGALWACYTFFHVWLSGDRGRRGMIGLLIPPAACALVVGTGLLAVAALTTGAMFELVVLPWTLLRGRCPSLLLPAFNAVKRTAVTMWLACLVPDEVTKQRQEENRAKAAKPAPRWHLSGAPENLTTGLRVTLSVLRFIFSVNVLLWRRALARGVRPDVVYCHDLYSLQAGIALKRWWGAQLVYDSHEYYPYQYEFWCYAPVMWGYESVLVRSVDRYLTVSPQLAAELSHVYGVATVHVIPNVEPRPISALRRANMEMSRLANGRLKVLYQGTFAEGRGLDEVVAAWRRVDGTKTALFLRGPRNPWLARLEELADDAGLLGTSIYVLSPVFEKDLIAAAQEADVGLIPYKTDRLSHRFACPNKLTQYLHAGLAILSNRIAFVEHIVGEGKLGLCYDIESSASFLKAVQRLAEDRHAVDEFKKNALVYAEREYNWERFEGVLLSLVAKAPPQRT